MWKIYLQDGVVVEEDKLITAEAIKDINADVLCLQEVESLLLLDKFNTVYLDDLYPYTMLIDGNDPRGIDVAILSKYPIENIRSNRAEKRNNRKVHSRDLLEVDIDLDGSELTIFTSHLKSMGGGREETKHIREAQVESIQNRIDKLFQKKPDCNFILCGDFSDKNDEQSALLPLLQDKNLVEAVSSLIENPREEQEAENTVNWIISFYLFEKNKGAVPEIYRKGLPRRVRAYTGDRLDGVGYDKPKASDHCAIYMDIVL
ncbi:hypothetical protein ABK040_016477 [Willaertia magna]